MRFGTFVPQGWKGDLDGIPAASQWERILAYAGSIEQLGYHSMWVYDHFHTHPVVKTESTFEAWSLMAALAATTQRARIGQMCTCALYRSPSLLAKMAASVDVISGGRLDVGIGAGWSRGEFEAYGYGFPPARDRLDMLEESVQVLLAMWSEDEAHFVGRHFQVRGAVNHPKPLQLPHPPLWIGGGGERRTLRIVAKYGDFANFTDGLANFRRKSQLLADHCESLGRPFDDVGRTAHLMAVIGRDTTDLKLKHEIAAKRRSCSPEDFKAEHLAVTIDQAVDEMGRFVEEGCVEMIVYFYDMGAGESLELFASEVIPQIR